MWRSVGGDQHDRRRAPPARRPVPMAAPPDPGRRRRGLHRAASAPQPPVSTVQMIPRGGGATRGHRPRAPPTTAHVAVAVTSSPAFTGWATPAMSRCGAGRMPPCGSGSRGSTCRDGRADRARSGPTGHQGIHVAVQRKNKPGELFGLVAGDAPSATWTSSAPPRRRPTASTSPGPTSRVRPETGSSTCRGAWSTTTAVRDVPSGQAAAHRGAARGAGRGRRRGGTGGRLGLTDEKGNPRCASVRPPAIEWRAADPTGSRASRPSQVGGPSPAAAQLRQIGPGRGAWPGEPACSSGHLVHHRRVGHIRGRQDAPVAVLAVGHPAARGSSTSSNQSSPTTQGVR